MGWAGPAVSVAVMAPGPSSSGSYGPSSPAAGRTAAGPAAAGRSDASAFRFALDAGPIEQEVAGTVVFELDALGRPEVRVPVRLVPGRPEWQCQVDADNLTLPYDYPSVLYATCTPAYAVDGLTPSARSLAAQIEDYRLDVSPVDLSGGPALRVRVQRLGQSWPRGSSPPELRFRITVTPPPRPAAFTLSARLTAVVGGRPAALSPRPVRVHAVDPRDAREHSKERPKEPRDDGYTLVVDFGTTYTTVGRADSNKPAVSRTSVNR